MTSFARLFIAVISATIILPLRTIEAQQHLEPEVRDVTLSKYRQLVESKIGRTPFDEGRAIIYPPFSGEYSVSVYATNPDARARKHFVTYAQAQQNLWQQTGALKNTQRARGVGVHRVNAEISEATASAIKLAWLHFLEPGNVKRAGPEPYRVGIDNVIGGLPRDFAIQTTDGPTLRGNFSRLPAPNTPVDALIKLTDLLITYCEAAPANRSVIEKQIQRNASNALQP